MIISVSDLKNQIIVVNATDERITTTLEAIEAINAIPDRVSLEDKALVVAARAAYAKIATTEQQALVTNYSKLISAEQRIAAMEQPTDKPEEEPEKELPESQKWLAWVVLGLGVVCVAIATVSRFSASRKAKKLAAKADQQEE